MDSIRVATLNIWNKSGPWKRRMELIAAELEALDPDVLGMQEVLQLETDNGVQNQTTEICGERHWAYGIAHDMGSEWVPKGAKLRFGNALISKHPIVESHVHPLPGADVSDQKRSLLHCVVQMPVGRVDVFVTHLNWRLDEGWIRQEQVKQVVAVMSDSSQGKDFPPILMGDLNAEPDADEIRYLLGKTSLGESRTVRFADAWEYGDGGPGYTFDAHRNHFAAQYHEPPRRLDYILVRGPDVKGRGRPINPRHAFHKDHDKVWCSDHFGVVTELAAK